MVPAHQIICQTVFIIIKLVLLFLLGLLTTSLSILRPHLLLLLCEALLGHALDAPLQGPKETLLLLGDKSQEPLGTSGWRLILGTHESSGFQKENLGDRERSSNQ